MREFTRYDVDVEITVKVKTDRGRPVGSFSVHGERTADSDRNPLTGAIDSAMKDVQDKVSHIAGALEDTEKNIHNS